MLPETILGSWVTTPATSAQLTATLDQYIECSENQSHDSGVHSINWTERTMFTFGDSDWAKSEGSLIFENRRGLLWRSNPKNLFSTHVIFLAMFSSSLVNLQHSVSELLFSNLKKPLNPAELDLNRAYSILSEEKNIVGVEYTYQSGDTIFRGEVSPLPTVDHAAVEGLLFVKLHLSLGNLESPVLLTRDGQVTFLDPNLTLEEVAQITSEIIEKVPLVSDGGTEPFKFAWGENPQSGGSTLGR